MKAVVFLIICMQIVQSKSIVTDSKRVFQQLDDQGDWSSEDGENEEKDDDDYKSATPFAYKGSQRYFVNRDSEAIYPLENEDNLKNQDNEFYTKRSDGLQSKVTSLLRPLKRVMYSDKMADIENIEKNTNDKLDEDNVFSRKDPESVKVPFQTLDSKQKHTKLHVKNQINDDVTVKSKLDELAKLVEKHSLLVREIARNNNDNNLITKKDTIPRPSQTSKRNRVDTIKRPYKKLRKNLFSNYADGNMLPLKEIVDASPIYDIYAKSQVLDPVERNVVRTLIERDNAIAQNVGGPLTNTFNYEDIIEPEKADLYDANMEGKSEGVDDALNMALATKNKEDVKRLEGEIKLIKTLHLLGESQRKHAAHPTFTGHHPKEKAKIHRVMVALKNQNSTTLYPNTPNHFAAAQQYHLVSPLPQMYRTSVKRKLNAEKHVKPTGRRSKMAGHAELTPAKSNGSTGLENLGEGISGESKQNNKMNTKSKDSITKFTNDLMTTLKSTLKNFTQYAFGKGKKQNDLERKRLNSRRGEKRQMNEFTFGSDVHLDPLYQGNVRIIHGTPPREFLNLFTTMKPTPAINTPFLLFALPSGHLTRAVTRTTRTQKSTSSFMWYKNRKVTTTARMTNKHKTTFRAFKRPTHHTPTGKYAAKLSTAGVISLTAAPSMLKEDYNTSVVQKPTISSSKTKYKANPSELLNSGEKLKTTQKPPTIVNTVEVDGSNDTNGINVSNNAKQLNGNDSNLASEGGNSSKGAENLSKPADSTKPLLHTYEVNVSNSNNQSNLLPIVVETFQDNPLFPEHSNKVLSDENEEELTTQQDIVSSYANKREKDNRDKNWAKILHLNVNSSRNHNEGSFPKYQMNNSLLSSIQEFEDLSLSELPSLDEKRRKKWTKNTFQESFDEKQQNMGSNKNKKNKEIQFNGIRSNGTSRDSNGNTYFRIINSSSDNYIERYMRNQSNAPRSHIIQSLYIPKTEEIEDPVVYKILAMDDANPAEKHEVITPDIPKHFVVETPDNSDKQQIIISLTPEPELIDVPKSNENQHVVPKMATESDLSLQNSYNSENHQTEDANIEQGTAASQDGDRNPQKSKSFFVMDEVIDHVVDQQLNRHQGDVSNFQSLISKSNLVNNDSKKNLIQNDEFKQINESQDLEGDIKEERTKEERMLATNSPNTIPNLLASPGMNPTRAIHSSLLPTKLEMIHNAEVTNSLDKSPSALINVSPTVQLEKTYVEHSDNLLQFVNSLKPSTRISQDFLARTQEPTKRSITLLKINETLSPSSRSSTQPLTDEQLSAKTISDEQLAQEEPKSLSDIQPLDDPMKFHPPSFLSQSQQLSDTSRETGYLLNANTTSYFPSQRSRQPTKSFSLSNSEQSTRPFLTTNSSLDSVPNIWLTSPTNINKAILETAPTKQQVIKQIPTPSKVNIVGSNSSLSANLSSSIKNVTSINEIRNTSNSYKGYHTEEEVQANIPNKTDTAKEIFNDTIDKEHSLLTLNPIGFPNRIQSTHSAVNESRMDMSKNQVLPDASLSQTFNATTTLSNKSISVDGSGGNQRHFLEFPLGEEMKLDDMYWTDSRDEIERACEDQKGTNLVVDILAFGDSLTRGYYNKGKGHHPYTMKLQYLLNNFDPRRCFIVDNEGKDGEPAFGEMPRRMESVLSKSKVPYKWAIILGGTNDIYNRNLKKNGRHSADDVTNNIISVHEIAHSHGLKTVAVTIPEVWCQLDGCKDMKEMRLHVNDNLRTFAGANKDKVILCDIAGSLERRKIDKKLIGQFFEGGLHLKPRGYETMARILFETFVQRLYTK